MKTALYRHYDADGALLYVGIALSPLARLAQHRASAWVHEIARVEIDWHETREAALEAERQAIIEKNPKHNKAGRGDSDVSRLIRAIGWEPIAARVGVTFSAVRAAKTKRKFPASWGAALADLCREHGQRCSVSSFNFVGSGSDCCITEIIPRKGADE